jgi:hypothetical protein
MKIETSNGEIVDKITILKIKESRINNVKKMKNIKKELSQLLPLLQEIGVKEKSKIYLELLNINEQLWEVEDNIREKEKLAMFDKEFIALARAAYTLNDRRSIIKKRINTTTDSFLMEEKSHDLS